MSHEFSPFTFEQIGVKELNNSSQFLTKAHNFAVKAHGGAFRLSGEPYIRHPENVEKIIFEEFGIKDEDINAAALLHDTVEDAGVTLETIRMEFNDHVARLVDGVSKLRSEKGIINKILAERENTKKIIKEQLIDPKVLVVKIADRLHNMRTLDFMPKEKQVSKAKETFGYVKMAESLGIWIPAKEMENLAMKYFDPINYDKYAKLIESDPRTQEDFVSWLKSRLETITNEALVDATIETRIISVPTLINKLGKYLPNNINDLISFRVLVKGDENSITRDRVYKLLGIFREKFGALEDDSRFDDFYSKPTDNGYSAIQQTFNFPPGATEVAITSSEKEDFNNWGVISLIRKNHEDISKYALKLLFTPTGEIKFFPRDASGIDFAYSISPGMGARAISMLIDGVKSSISTVPTSGSEVKIEIGPPRIAPDKKIIQYCLPKTQSIIEEQLLEEKRSHLELTGKNMIAETMSKRGVIDMQDLLKIENIKPKLESVLYQLGCKGSINMLYYKIGSGVMNLNDLEKHLDNIGLTKEGMRLTSIFAKTVHKPGVFADLTALVAKSQGNICSIDAMPETGRRRKHYTIRLLIEGLSKRDEEKISGLLNKDQRFKKVIIV